MLFPSGQGGLLEHVIAAKAICCKEAMEPNFKAYQQQVVKNTQVMTKIVIERTECRDLAAWICDILEAIAGGDSSAVEAEVQATVEAVYRD